MVEKSLSRTPLDTVLIGQRHFLFKKKVRIEFSLWSTNGPMLKQFSLCNYFLEILVQVRLQIIFSHYFTPG